MLERLARAGAPLVGADGSLHRVYVLAAALPSDFVAAGALYWVAHVGGPS